MVNAKDTASRVRTAFASLAAAPAGPAGAPEPPPGMLPEAPPAGAEPCGMRGDTP